MEMKQLNFLHLVIRIKHVILIFMKRTDDTFTPFNRTFLARCIPFTIIVIVVFYALIDIIHKIRNK